MPGWEGRAHVVRALDGGITNRNLLIEVDGEHFVLRLAGKDTALLEIDRTVEFEAATRAATLGLAPEVVGFLEPEGYLITRFVAGSPIPPDELATPPRLESVVAMLRKFHESGPLPHDFDAFRVPSLHRDAAVERGVPIPAAFDEARVIARRIETAFAASPEPNAPCHNDMLNANFLVDRNDGTERIWLIDWEYAGNNDRYFDLGNLAVNNDFDPDAGDALLRAYFGSVTPRRSARLELMMIMSDFREAMWGVVQQGISTLDFDYVAYADRHFDRLRHRSERDNFEALLVDAASGASDA